LENTDLTLFLEMSRGTAEELAFLVLLGRLHVLPGLTKINYIK
jgi:hypothetical protein